MSLTAYNYEYSLTIHLGRVDPSTVGPSIGPSMGPGSSQTSTIPPVLPPSLPPNPVTGAGYAGASISSGPQPASLPLYPGFQPGYSLPSMPGYPGSYGGGPPVDGLMAGMHPSRLAALGAPGVAGVTRSADEMGGADAPPAKRPKMEKLPEGQYYPVSIFYFLYSLSLKSEDE